MYIALPIAICFGSSTSAGSSCTLTFSVGGSEGGSNALPSSANVSSRRGPVYFHPTFMMSLRTAADPP